MDTDIYKSLQQTIIVNFALLENRFTFDGRIMAKCSFYDELRWQTILKLPDKLI
jgi:hypothetical protein